MKSGQSFGMPLDLAPLRSGSRPLDFDGRNSWYEQGRCAVVANVGTLARPVTKAEFKAGVGLRPTGAHWLGWPHGPERSAAPQGHILGQDDPPITAVGAL